MSVFKDTNKGFWFLFFIIIILDYKDDFVFTFALILLGITLKWVQRVLLNREKEHIHIGYGDIMESIQLGIHIIQFATRMTHKHMTWRGLSHGFEVQQNSHPNNPPLVGFVALLTHKPPLKTHKGNEVHKHITSPWAQLGRGNISHNPPLEHITSPWAQLGRGNISHNPPLHTHEGLEQKKVQINMHRCSMLQHLLHLHWSLWQ